VIAALPRIRAMGGPASRSTLLPAPPDRKEFLEPLLMTI